MTRVVSLLPAATEIVASLGARTALVGVSHECDYPADVRDLPRVTRSAVGAAATPRAIDASVRERSARGEPLFALDDARIAALAPDVILTQGLCEVCAVSDADVRSLAATLDHTPRVVSLDASSLDGVFGDIATVGAALHCADEADELCAGMRLRLRMIHAALKRANAPRPRVAVIEWTDPVFVAGHWVPEMLSRAGGQDTLASPGQHSRLCTVGEIRDARADVVIMAPCGLGLARSAADARAALARDEWSWAASREVWAIDANALTSRPGPRLARGVETFARILHPGLFGPPSPALTLRIA
jgi:iron complex transport system substrate-binding protein